ATTAAASHAGRLDRRGLAAARPAHPSPIATAAAVAMVGVTAATAASAVATIAAGKSGSRLTRAAAGSKGRQAHLTVTRSRRSAKTFGETSPRVWSSSALANGLAVRARTIAAAVAGPMPGRASSSFAVALLTLTFVSAVLP